MVERTKKDKMFSGANFFSAQIKLQRISCERRAKRKETINVHACSLSVLLNFSIYSYGVAGM